MSFIMSLTWSIFLFILGSIDAYRRPNLVLAFLEFMGAAMLPMFRFALNAELQPEKQVFIFGGLVFWALPYAIAMMLVRLTDDNNQSQEEETDDE
jgi:hypothetical protein